MIETMKNLGEPALVLAAGMLLLLLVLRNVREKAMQQHEDEIAERIARRYRLAHQRPRMGRYEHQHQHHGSRSLRG